jgi:hypothetical protein
MENLKQHHTLLNRLLLAQMYRTEAYRKALESTTEPEFRGFFAENTRMGEMLIEEITENINPLYVTETEDTDIPTQYQRVWTMLPDVMFGTGKNELLDNYVTGESLTIRLYNEALQNAAALPINVREMLLRQRVMLMRVVDKARQLKASKLQVMFRRFSQIKRLFLQRLVSFQ